MDPAVQGSEPATAVKGIAVHPPPPVHAYPAAGTPPTVYPPAPTLVAAPPNTFAAQAPVWSTGLFDCMDDVGNCCLTFWCPCITFGRIAEILDRGTSSCGMSGAMYALIMHLTGCQWIYSFAYRTKLRAQYNLPEAPCCDCLVHYCCEPCALCQAYRELRNRGYDVDIDPLVFFLPCDILPVCVNGLITARWYWYMQVGSLTCKRACSRRWCSRA